MTFRTIAVVLVGTLCLSLAAAAELVRAGSQSKQPVAQRADGGFWRTDQGFKSELVLTNVVKTESVVVTPVLYLALGTRYQLAPVTLPPLGVARVSINDALADAPAALRSHLADLGSVSIEYIGRWQYVMASVNALDVGRSLVFTSRLSSANSRFTSVQESVRHNKLVVNEGVWWRHDPDVDGFVALMNTTASEKTVRLAIFPSPSSDMQTGASGLVTNGGHNSEFRVAPHATELVDLGLALFDKSAVAGGVTISYMGDASDVRVSGGLENPRIGYSSRIPFLARPETPDTENFMSAAVGLMRGTPDPMMMFPDGTVFTPYGVVRNIGLNTASVTPAINYMVNGQTITKQLPPLSLAPNEAVVLLNNELQRLGLGNYSGSINLVVGSTAKFGEILFTAGSVDKTGTYVFEVSCNALRKSSKILFGEWNIADGNDTMISVWNPTNIDEDVVLHLYHDADELQFPIHLPKGTSTMVNASQIIMESRKSNSGVAPLTAQYGSAVLSGKSSENVMIGVSYGIYNVKTATCRNLCGACNVYTAFEINYFPPLQVGGQLGLTATAMFQDGSSKDETFSPTTWSSSNTSVATNSGHTFTGVAAGYFWATATAQLESGNCDDLNKYCTYLPPQSTSAGGVVQVPTYFGPTGADPLNATGMGCATGAGGEGFTVHYQVLDQNGNAMAVSGMTPQERVYINGVVQGPPYWNAFGIPRTTPSDGKFDDDPIGTCFGPPNPSQMVCNSVTQAFQVVFNNVTYPIQTEVSRTDCNTGIQAVISGNPTAYNKTFQQGSY